MDPATIALLASAGTSIAGMVSTSATNSQNNSFVAEQNRINREWQESMYDKNNAYNTPVMQMARFKEAGLNPHLIYGQGNAGNATMASAPQQSVKHNEPLPMPAFADALSLYVGMKKQQTEIKNLETSSKVMDADIALKRSQELKNLTESAKSQQDQDFVNQVWQTRVAQEVANLTSTNTGIERTQADTQRIMANINQIHEQILSSVQGRRESAQRILESQARIPEISQRIAESVERVRLLQAQGNKTAAEAEIMKIKQSYWELGINPDNASVNLWNLIGKTAIPVATEAAQVWKNKHTIHRPGTSSVNDTYIQNKR